MKLRFRCMFHDMFHNVPCSCSVAFPLVFADSFHFTPLITVTEASPLAHRAQGEFLAVARTIMKAAAAGIVLSLLPLADAFAGPGLPAVGLRVRSAPQMTRVRMYSRGDELSKLESATNGSKDEVTEVEKKQGTQWTMGTTESSRSPSVGGTSIVTVSDGDMEPLSEASIAFNTILVTVLKGVIDIVYKGRDYPRFFVLETVARVPYFSYMSVLHFYETMGLHRKANWIKVHYAEADNELHHLLVMESLGGAEVPIDRLLAGNAAFFYYWMVVFMYIVNPRGAYNLSQMIEDHAYKTYDKFLKDNEEMLKAEKAPQVALDYYMGSDMYMFDAFHTANSIATRRPKIENLYDVFVCIRDDENEHRSTLKQLVDEGRICSAECTPSAACGSIAENCNVDSMPTARGMGTQYSSPTAGKAFMDRE